MKIIKVNIKKECPWYGTNPELGEHDCCINHDEDPCPGPESKDCPLEDMPEPDNTKTCVAGFPPFQCRFQTIPTGAGLPGCLHPTYCDYQRPKDSREKELKDKGE